MGVCTVQERPNKKNENNSIKISKDFYLSGIINGSERINKREVHDDVEPPIKDIQISISNKKSDNEKDNDLNKSNNSEIKINKSKNGNKNIDDASQPMVTILGDPNENDGNKESQINYEFIGNKNINNDDGNRNEPEVKNTIVNAGMNLPSVQKDNLDNINAGNINNITNSLNMLDNYKDFDINKEYYLICSDCNSYITYIYSVDFDSDKKDYKFTYKCQCEQNVNENKDNYFHLIISNKILKCQEHPDSDIKYLCEICKKQICRECKECKDSNTHLGHDTKYIINNEVIPDSIMDTIKENKDSFKGYDIFEKIFDYYKKTRLPEEQSSLRNSGQSQNDNKSNNKEQNQSELNNNENKENIPEQNEQNNLWDDNRDENNEEKKVEEVKIKSENGNSNERDDENIDKSKMDKNSIKNENEEE